MYDRLASYPRLWIHHNPTTKPLFLVTNRRVHYMANVCEHLIIMLLNISFQGYSCLCCCNRLLLLEKLFTTECTFGISTHLTARALVRSDEKLFHFVATVLGLFSLFWFMYGWDGQVSKCFWQFTLSHHTNNTQIIRLYGPLRYSLTLLDFPR